MNPKKQLSILSCFNLYVTFILVVSSENVYDSKKCVYPAIYNFGDSNSDTGAVYATFTSVQPPNGISFFGSLSGRASDGRLIIDYITEELKLPYLSAYLNSVGSNYRHGANFAVGGASIRPGGYSPINLGLQVSQFILFKSHTKILFNQLSNNNRTEPPFRSGLPRSEEFSKALYTIDIGQNDLAIGLQHTSEEQVIRSIPDILIQYSQAVQQLYNEGARVFWIHNVGPIGCLPYDYIYYQHKNGNLDANGCVKPHNEIAQEFNKQLKDLVFQIRRKLPLAKFTYVDVYTAKYKLISNSKSLGFVSPLEFCCGSYYGYHINCGKKAIINGTIYGNPCTNPSQHISWDGIHYSQAANQWVAKQILYGSLSDPPVSIGKASCALIHVSSEKCVYPAIYNFGDSNSDTGTAYAISTRVQPPNGISFFGNISGRYSDGRLIIDFITEELKLPYLSAYLNSVGSNYRHGANFAAGGASIRPGGYTPINLGLQVSQFILFKSQTKILFNQLSNNRTEPPFKSALPRNEEFSKALYTIDIGQNDLAYGFQHTSEEQVQRSIPDILSQFSLAVKQLYNEGARVFWIHNTGPVGCLPINYFSYEPKKGNIDANGCVIPQNKIAEEFNKKLKDQVFQLRRNLTLAKFTYVDVYKAKYELISNAKSQGFVSLLNFCCGSYTGYRTNCGPKEIINGTVNGNLCTNPSQHIIWDGVHYSQRANQLIAKEILYGSFSDPPVPIGNACF